MKMNKKEINKTLKNKIKTLKLKTKSLHKIIKFKS